MKGKRPYMQAMEDALAFRAMFRPACYERWEFAGSIRRGKPEVGDIEHVIIPRWEDRPDPLSMFGLTVPTNLLWLRLEELVSAGTLARHQYETHLADGSVVGRERWGNSYRGVDFRDFNHELFTATADNWGAILLIRTGPAEFSERVVTRIKQGGMYRQQNGNLIHVRSGDVVPVRDELAFLRFASMDWCEPKERK